MAITREALLAAGFQAFAFQDMYVRGNIVYQLTETAGNEKLYFIEAKFFEYLSVGLQFEAKLYLPESDPASTHTGFTLTLPLADDLTIEAVRKFFADAYYRLGCCPDPHSND
jgi:hypothetical protein